MIRQVLYLHGFRSTPNSVKARMVYQGLAKRGLGDRFVCPPLSVSPAEVAQSLLSLSSGWLAEETAVIGSSLGGYYATWLAEQLGCRAVLLNPSVNPDQSLAQHIGTQRVYGCEEWIEVLPEHLNQLRDLRVDSLHDRGRYWLVCATGDEILDWRGMADFYAGCRMTVIQGGNHALDDFAEHIEPLLDFCLGVNQ